MELLVVLLYVLFRHVSERGAEKLAREQANVMRRERESGRDKEQ